MPFAFVNLSVRNDGSAPHRIPSIHFCATKEQMIEYLNKESPLDEEEIERILDNKPIWQWEWMRKGNGDLYVLRECKTTVGSVLQMLTDLHLFDSGDTQIIREAIDATK